MDIKIVDYNKEFEFDFYIELEKNTFALIKKNALMGIYKFETQNNFIKNIDN